jgi:LmbE family N-acetylglucosaminyl deacetylase
MMASGDMPYRVEDLAAELLAPPDGGRNLLMVVAHPDDEAVGLGGHLLGLPALRLVYITDGAPHDLRDARSHGFADGAAYRATRRRELEATLRLANISLRQVTFLDLPDQEAMLHLGWLTERLVSIFCETGARVVLTHPYEGGHPDHDATAFAVRTACGVLERTEGGAPAIVEMASYHLGPDSTVYQRFIEDPAYPEMVLRLGKQAAAAKRRFLACHVSQAETLARFRDNEERIRLAPPYDFGRLPNGGRLQYEVWGLGQGRDWLRHVRPLLYDPVLT